MKRKGNNKEKPSISSFLSSPSLRTGMSKEEVPIKSFQGLRPRFNDLIKSYLETNPLNRPTAKEIYEIFDAWNLQIGLREQIRNKQQFIK
ncbi:hypothetical protein C1646_751100 [Rhizophagus diaphanus]|nr:hypothetical protein C1646_751100 [Rhizophagus diaphanus] [Rhizophagus sp. MUCL 43196]